MSLIIYLGWTALVHRSHVLSDCGSQRFALGSGTSGGNQRLIVPSASACKGDTLLQQGDGSLEHDSPGNLKNGQDLEWRAFEVKKVAFL